MEGITSTKFNVSGVQLDRPFKIRRLAHFGFNTGNMSASLKFYTDLFGFSISDETELGWTIPDEAVRKSFAGETTGYFMRHGSDHHSFFIFPKRFIDYRSGPLVHDDMTVNHMTWQVGSLREVTGAEDWFRELNTSIDRSGRAGAGTNWQVYWRDPDEYMQELCYGIEQIGWNGLAKPKVFRKLRLKDKPDSPQKPEYEEVDAEFKEGLDLLDTYRYTSQLEAIYDVGGIMLPRPFKITRTGPVRLFVDDVATTQSYYCDRLGMSVTEEVTYNGHRCVFLRVNTEHHSMALYPRALRKELGLNEHTSCLSFGMQVGGYDQLRDAVSFFEGNEVEVKYLPPELFPGIDYSAFAIDPDGHAIQLYYYMEQIGWDGKPRPARKHPQVAGVWPDSVEPLSDTFGGEVRLGPLA